MRKITLTHTLALVPLLVGLAGAATTLTARADDMGMAKDGMAKDGMAKDDKMAKHHHHKHADKDAMGKDGMAKGDAMAKDGMGK